MKKTEIVKLFYVIWKEFKNFERTDERRDIWHAALIDLSYDQAFKNFIIHCRESEYEPRPANILRYDPEIFTDYNRLRLDTQTYLQQREEHQRSAINCPPHLKPKFLTGGEPDA